MIQWLTTAPSPRTPATGFDAGQRGWKLHAIITDNKETFVGIGRRASVCGIRPSHGWGMDMFIEDKCKRCTNMLKKVKDTTTTSPPASR